MGSETAISEARPIVVGVDGSRTTPAIVDLAAAEAVRHRAPLMIVHVWPGRYTGIFRSRQVVPSMADGRRLLEVMSRRAQLAGHDLPIGTELLEGGAARVLTRWSARARLLIVGHRDDPLTRPSWGSTAAYLAHHSACPLLVHRGAVARDGPVVVAASARPSGSATLGYAFAEAALLGSRLVAVHMWTRPGAAEGSAPVIAAGGYATERAAAAEELADALAGWSVRYPEVRVDQLVVPDLDMHYTIERASRRGRLLVAGIGRHGRFAELLYGSLGPGPGGLRLATCPVVLVPAGRSVARRAPAPDEPIAAGPS
jgi:nucleotide-binding universal stress UspA family protein